ncbi:lysozyme inhibitor LprI family protein [Flavobacterium sp. 7A]|uniref:lysozyme inhibitor LprI family protein n=1 Tax=Flavobacterium sp. 7A TaxID=2940571 RepID=UPI002226205F|nr:lysozyme inhibitor LprI family protein [Flavobacterium sp. 7A]MCW2118637.1 uncharacterized protein YecT (DUF1311 family)/TPR repeat protein [Flavobacterium sp. 7A]
MADSAYTAGNKDKAKELYTTAASMNNPDAHYALAYKYVLTDEERIFHYSEAAKMGHQESVGAMFEALLFRANSLTLANPEQALEIYNQAKAQNPSLTIFNEKEYLATVKKCVEAGPFDAKKFIEQYNIKENELNGPYSIWELAEEASRGGRFGKPNTKLVLQLISRGSFVPAELEFAVDSIYKNWKANKPFVFNICDYVSSGSGLSYCSAKAEKQANKEYSIRIEKLTARLQHNAGNLLLPTFTVAEKFIEEKAWKEELNGGTGYAAWTRASIMKQKNDYLNLVEKINKGIKPDTLANCNEADRKLNKTYQRIVSQLKKKPINDFNASVDYEGLRSVQRLWIGYRDASAVLFHQLAPSISEIVWKNWLTEIRTKELNQILEFSY